jgi:Leucine-rich repeat (LRR) protein
MSSRWDIIDITKYAANIIDNCPNDITEIKIDGSFLYSYYRIQMDNTININDEGLSYNYSEYAKYADELNEYMSKLDEDLDSESLVKKKYASIFNQYYDWFWYSNNTSRLYGNIIVDLARFTHLEAFYIYQIYVKKLIHIPKTLKTMYCISCQIHSLSALPKCLTALNCSGNKLKTLPRLQFIKLQSLFANSNFLKKLPNDTQILRTFVHKYQG